MVNASVSPLKTAAPPPDAGGVIVSVALLSVSPQPAVEHVAMIVLSPLDT